MNEDQTVNNRAEAPDLSPRRVALAGVGAVALACDMAADAFNRFAERGERIQSEVRGRADEVRQQNAGARQRVGDYIRTGMDVMLNRLNLPSKGDVDTINAKLNNLARKMDDIQYQSIAPTPTTPGQPEAPSARPPDDNDELAI